MQFEIVETSNASADPSKTLHLSTKPLEITTAGPSESPLAALGRLSLRKHCTCRQIRENDPRKHCTCRQNRESDPRKHCTCRQIRGGDPRKHCTCRQIRESDPRKHYTCRQINRNYCCRAFETTIDCSQFWLDSLCSETLHSFGGPFDITINCDQFYRNFEVAIQFAKLWLTYFTFEITALLRTSFRSQYRLCSILTNLSFLRNHWTGSNLTLRDLTGAVRRHMRI